MRHGLFDTSSQSPPCSYNYHLGQHQRLHSRAAKAHLAAAHHEETKKCKFLCSWLQLLTYVVCVQIYKSEAVPVEEYFDEQGLLMNFEITGGIPETLPRLIDALRPHMRTITEQRRKWNAKQAQLNGSSSTSSQASTATTAASRLTVAPGSASPAYGLGVSTSRSGRQLQLAQA